MIHARVYALASELFHNDLWCGPRVTLIGQFVSHALGKREKRARFGTVRLLGHNGRSGIGGLADRGHKRNLAEEIRAELRRRLARAAVAEDVTLLAAMRAVKRAHVLDNAEHRDGGGLEHRKTLARIDKRQ